MNGASNKVVCVTEASGYIGSWLVKLLLQQGYTVKAAVLYPNDPKKTQHLLSLDGAKERLHLFKADLLEEGSFDPVVDGCQGVFHTASPVSMSSTNNPQAELIDSAVKETLNVLKSSAKFSTVKRVVLTSSMASMLLTGKPVTSDVVVDETWFSDPLLCEKYKLRYLLSKILAEEAAWKFAKENGIDLVSINPGVVIGSLLQPILNHSVEVIQNIITGKTLLASNYRFIYVTDVASAHIQVFELPSASGRYCLVSHATHISEALKNIRQLHPTLYIPESGEDNLDILPYDPSYQVSKEKAKGLGMNFFPFEVMLKDTVVSQMEKVSLKNFSKI